MHITMVHMPALNTPQFNWARNKLPQRPTPLPPIFQPEVAARAIVFAASARRREIYVGGPTVQAVFANMVAPGLLDRLLARKGYSGQLSKELETPGRPDNLFEPVGNGYAAHGRFDRRATDRSIELWLSEHRGAPGPALAMLSLAAGVGMAALIPIRARGRPR